MIEIQDVSKQFDCVTALRHLTLKVQDGSVFGLVGSNGAHNNAHHLVQCHNAGIYKAHGHHGHGAGGLDHGGHAGAQQHALNAVVGHFFQHGLEFAAAHFFQAAAHHIHAKEKECQTADQA
jgi:ABC-type transporter Mla maintaining outer membrane lipid asymmetry ATPase subunit MlaF